MGQHLKAQLTETGSQKTKEMMTLCRKFGLVENSNDEGGRRLIFGKNEGVF